MLHSFRFKNFFSFSAETEISFLVSKASAKNNLSTKLTTGQNVSKVMSVIGANASGKTSVLKAMSFLSWFIAGSFSHQDYDEDIFFEPHFFHENENTEFEFIFDLEGNLYKYTLITTRKNVMYEALHIKKTSRFSYIFKRMWDEEDQTYDVFQQGFGFTSKEAKKVRKNVSLLSTASQYGVEKSLLITKAISYTLCDVGIYGRIDARRDIDELIEVAELFHSTPRLEKKASKILCRMDLGLQKVFTKMEVFRGEDKQEKSFPVPYGVHVYKDNKKTLELWKESSGTQRVYRLLRFIIPALELGSLVVIDELEADLHPDMLEPIIKLFIDKETNPHNAQIIFSSHSHEIMDLLNKEQVLLVEKDEACSSEAWRLDDVQGVRRGDNLYAKYRSGAYGAVPNI